MATYQETLVIQTSAEQQTIGITRQVEEILESSGIKQGICHVYSVHATSGIAINVNDDPMVAHLFHQLLDDLTTRVLKENMHLEDRNAAAHLKSSLIGPEKSIPIKDGRLNMGAWQDILFCEFDGPRAGRKIVVSIVS
jgi:secondary thiamine-phosphate synthase enzyme